MRLFCEQPYTISFALFIALLPLATSAAVIAPRLAVAAERAYALLDILVISHRLR